MKYKGNYIAVPVNVHRVNWLWANPEAFKKAGAKVPTTWDEFFVAAEALKKAGITPVAHGGQNWQDFTTFESRGPGRGRRRLLQEGAGAAGPGHAEERDHGEGAGTYKRIKGYTDKNAAGRDWNLATAMVIKGEAGMQIMGDWAKGEFVAAGKVPGKDFVCVAAPGHGQELHLQRRLLRDVQAEERRQREGAEGPGRGHHVHRLSRRPSA
jgi:glucose/mannose transport system substrate-binding protein